MGLWANGQAGRRCGKAVCRPVGKACPFPSGGEWLFHRQSGRFPHFHSAGLILGDDTRTARRQQAVQRQWHIPRRHQQPPDKDAAADKTGKDEVQKELIESSRIFHFGTLSSTHEGVREATRHAIELAKEAGCIITFDPNLRPPLWKSLDDARAEIEYGMSKCDVLKISDNEVEFMCGTTDYDKGAAMIQEKYNIPLILITLGKDGSRAYYKNMRVEAAPFLQENTIETTGAGDTFCASTLNYVLDHGLNDLTEENLKELLTFANAAASLITTRKGALRVMPTREEVEAFIESRK